MIKDRFDNRMNMQISIKDGGRAPYSVDLSSFNKDVISFGREHDNDIVLGSDFVSRIHGVFFIEDSNLYIEDLKSKNGITYMGNKIKKHRLKEGDVIVINAKGKKQSNNVEIKILSTSVPQKADKKTPDKNRKYIWIGAGTAGVLLITLITLFATGVIGGRKSSGGGGGSAAGKTNTAYDTEEDTGTEDSYMGETYTPDMDNESDAYFAEISERIIRTYKAEDSTNKKTGKEAVDLLAQRGFEEYDVTVNMTPDGEIADETVIADDCNESYPMYTSYYYSESEDIWVIYIMDGKVFANPLFYNLESDEGVMVIFSESKSLISYDYYEKSFYETIPLDTAMRFIVVDSIDSETLDLYTADKIKDME